MTDADLRLPKLVFVHIGKTAGTSLRAILSNAFGAGACSEAFVQSYMTEAEARAYGAFPVICGHISRADQLRWFPDRSTMTILREPIDRCLSFIHYVRSLVPQSVAVARDARDLPVFEFIQTEEAQRNLHNTMVRQLGGHLLDPPNDFAAQFQRANEALRGAFWVGYHDSLESDVARLGRLLGRDLKMRRDNITPGRPRIDDEDPALIDRLRAMNEYDLQLWSWAKQELPA